MVDVSAARVCATAEWWDPATASLYSASSAAMTCLPTFRGGTPPKKLKGRMRSVLARHFYDTAFEKGARILQLWYSSRSVVYPMRRLEHCPIPMFDSWYRTIGNLTPDAPSHQKRRLVFLQ